MYNGFKQHKTKPQRLCPAVRRTILAVTIQSDQSAAPDAVVVVATTTRTLRARSRSLNAAMTPVDPSKALPVSGHPVQHDLAGDLGPDPDVPASTHGFDVAMTVDGLQPPSESEFPLLLGPP